LNGQQAACMAGRAGKTEQVCRGILSGTDRLFLALARALPLSFRTLALSGVCFPEAKRLGTAEA